MSDSKNPFGYVPPGGWVCFHCHEVFRTPGGAANHFGVDVIGPTLCQVKAGGERGLGMALRSAQQAILQVSMRLANGGHEVPNETAKECLDALLKYQRHWKFELQEAANLKGEAR